MTERELLEYAAKAAGYKIEGDIDKLVAQPGHYAGGFSIFNKKGGSSPWNPLTDDGDAFRLAFQCRLILEMCGPQFFIVRDDTGCMLNTQSTNHIDPIGIMRRCITSAAAEIGRNMK